MGDLQSCAGKAGGGGDGGGGEGGEEGGRAGEANLCREMVLGMLGARDDQAVLMSLSVLLAAMQSQQVFRV
jgi:hypothetical protein